MAIQEQNIVFLQSQVMDDVPEGGGAAVNVPVVDGQANNVFDDISDLDRAYGRFNLRKLFLAVRSLDTDKYGGAKIAITELPQDPAVSYTLFTRHDPFDTRAQAADRVTNYLVKSSAWNGVMFGNHLTGMRTLQILQPAGSRIPPVGKTLCIVQNEGLATEREQYVRLVAVEYETRSFEELVGNELRTYQRIVVTCTLSDPLRHDYAGHEAAYKWQYSFAGRAMIRDTFVADAASYYGTVRLRDDAEIGDYTIRAASVYAQLVPSAETEVPHVDQPLLPSVSSLLSAGVRTVEVSQQAHTMAINVTVENRRATWIHTLNVAPMPGTITISFMALGNWYDLRDDGAGAIAGDDPSVGSGTIDYDTGTVAITLGVLPDANSMIVITWGSPAHYDQRTGAGVASAPTFRLTTEHAIQPGSLTITWDDGEPREATVSEDGIISGDATGSVRHASREIIMTPSVIPPPGTEFELAYQRFSAVDEALDVALDGDAATFTLGTTPVKPRSVVIKWLVNRYKDDVGYATEERYVVDNGFGGLLAESGQPIGTIDYDTGVCTLDPVVREYSRKTWKVIQAGGAFAPDIWGWGDTAAKETDQRYFRAYYVEAQSDANSHMEQVDAGELTLTVAATVDDDLVPNSVVFTMGSRAYIDRDGVMLYGTGESFDAPGVAAGAIDYDAKLITLTDWEPGSPTVNVTSALTRKGQWTAKEAHFRTDHAPLKPEAFQLVGYIASSGAQFSAVPDADGDIDTDKVDGKVEYALGFGAVTFSQPVVPETLRYNAVSFAYLPLNADILGVDPVRLPSNGRVPIFRPGDVALIMHAAETTGTPDEVVDGEDTRYELSLGRTRIAWVRVRDAEGKAVTEGYELDRVTGKLIFESLDGLALPLTTQHTVADLRMVTDVQITGHIKLSRPLTHDFPAGSLVASCLLLGDRRARVAAVWDQQSWNGSWSDEPGTPATATLNLIDHPIQVTNEGCDTDRWVLRWTSTTTVELISEKRGLIWSGTYTPGGPDIAPINPRTRNEDGTGGVPYLVIPGAANGGGWQAGNIVRINTVGAIADFWIARAIQQSDEPLDDGADGCEIYALGNIDRP